MFEDDIPDFTLRSFLGSSGFGELWSGRHVPTDSRVVIKLLHPNIPPNALVAMTQDIGIVTRIAWSGIARAWQSGTTWRRRPYVVYELVEGETLARRIASRRIPAAEVADILYQAATSLGVAARYGQFHGHLSPSNLIVVPDRDKPAGERVVITDLGTRRLVEAGPWLASATYLAPEQLQGAALDHSVDVYALGSIAFELLIGRPALTATSWQQAQTMHARESIPPPRTIMADIPLAVDRLIVKMLDQEPRKRPTLAEVTKLADVILGMEAPMAETRKEHAVK